jgi:hypothetical protein
MIKYTDYGFLANIKPMVIEDMKRSGILASVTAAQAFIESNKGNSGLATKGNNLFGIKGEYNGQSVNMETTEYVNGIPIRVHANFRKYPSWAESIADHSAMFNRMKRYANLRNLTNYKLACQLLQKDGYATSPTYANTLINCIETYQLYKWDEEVTGVVDTAPPTGNPYMIPTKNVRLNSRGNDVRWLQYALNSKGGYRLIVDGIAGNLTIGAVMDWQKKHGLVVDGIVGPNTRKSLMEDA